MIDAVLSAVANLVILAGLPFLAYWLWHRIRHRRGMVECARRAGLNGCKPRYLVYSLLASAVVVGALVNWPPPIEPFTREGSAQREFVGLGLTAHAIFLSLLYGVVKTGFAEEFFFRGLIAGSLARRLSPGWANLVQAVVFLLPHLLLLVIMPEMAWVLVLIFAGALFMGWLRIKSDSILGPWLIHAVANVTVCLSVALRTA